MNRCLGRIKNPIGGLRRHRPMKMIDECERRKKAEHLVDLVHIHRIDCVSAIRVDMISHRQVPQNIQKTRKRNRSDRHPRQAAVAVVRSQVRVR